MATKTSLYLVLLIFIVAIFICFVIPYKKNKTKQSKSREIHTPLTKETLRNYKGLENITDKEAEKIICSLRRYTELTYKLFQKEKTNSIAI
ncbi:MAG: hypothetical protein WBM13_02820 [Bacteroidia bacterium]